MTFTAGRCDTIGLTFLSSQLDIAVEVKLRAGCAARYRDNHLPPARHKSVPRTPIGRQYVGTKRRPLHPVRGVQNRARCISAPPCTVPASPSTKPSSRPYLLHQQRLQTPKAVPLSTSPLHPPIPCRYTAHGCPSIVSGKSAMLRQLHLCHNAMTLSLYLPGRELTPRLCMSQYADVRTSNPMENEKAPAKMAATKTELRLNSVL